MTHRGMKRIGITILALGCFAFGVSLSASAQDPCCSTTYRLECQTVWDEQEVTAFRIECETQYEERQVTRYRPEWFTEDREAPLHRFSPCP